MIDKEAVRASFALAFPHLDWAVNATWICVATTNNKPCMFLRVPIEHKIVIEKMLLSMDWVKKVVWYTAVSKGYEFGVVFPITPGGKDEAHEADAGGYSREAAE